MSIIKVKKGFTLVELLSVIAIIAVAVAVAAPNFRGIIAKNKVVNLSNEILGLAQYARINAVTTNKVMLLCPVKALDAKNKGTCSMDGATKIIVGVYGETVEALKQIDIPNTVSLENKSKGQLGVQVAFLPDGASGLFAVDSKEIKIYEYEKNGSLNKTPVTVSADSLPTKGDIIWQIKSKGNPEHCSRIQLFASGQATILPEGCK